MRHILIAAEVTASDVDSAEAHAKQVVRGGPGWRFVRLAAACSGMMRTEEREASAVPLDKLPEVYKRGILGIGHHATVLPPFALESPGGGKKFAIVMVTERRGDGEITLPGCARPRAQILSEDLAMQKYLGPAPPRDLRRGAGLLMRRLAVTLGDPRGIGPEITRAALQLPLDAAITVVGPDDLIEDIPAAHRVGVGTLGPGYRRPAGPRAHAPRRPARRSRRRGRGAPGAGGRRRRHRHRAGQQARPPPGRLSLSRTHRVAGAPVRRRAGGDDARLRSPPGRARHDARRAA